MVHSFFSHTSVYTSFEGAVVVCCLLLLLLLLMLLPNLAAAAFFLFLFSWVETHLSYTSCENSATF